MTGNHTLRQRNSRERSHLVVTEDGLSLPRSYQETRKRVKSHIGLFSGIIPLSRKHNTPQGSCRSVATVITFLVVLLLVLGLLLLALFHPVLRTSHLPNPTTIIPTSFLQWEETKYHPHFSSLETNNPSNHSLCSCLSCMSSQTSCGGIWWADTNQIRPEEERVLLPTTSKGKSRISLVLSHCKSDLSWVQDFVTGYDIHTIDIISKCGHPIIGAPPESNIIRLPNLGRCDHSYAWWILQHLENPTAAQELKQTPHLQDEDIILFLKDDMSPENNHQSGWWRTLPDIIRIVQTSSFACAMMSSGNTRLCSTLDEKENYGCVGDYVTLSAYHVKDILLEFDMNEYQHNTKGYMESGDSFKSNFTNLGNWLSSFPNLNLTSELVQVCYGGAFAVKWKQILTRQTVSFWTALEASLTRGNSIEEGHFAERSWAALLSPPPTQFESLALNISSDGIYVSDKDYKGCLVRKPKFYLHVGPPDGDASRFRKNLKQSEGVLLQDGYRLFHDDAFYNVASCLTLQRFIDLDLSTDFPEEWQEACQDFNYYHEAYAYLGDAMNEGYDIIASDGRLSFPGLKNVGDILGTMFEVHVLILYYRYYDWLFKLFLVYREHNEIENDPMSDEYWTIFKDLPRQYRYYRFIDFIRYLIQWQLKGKRLGVILQNHVTHDPVKSNVFHKEFFTETTVHFADNLVHPAFIAEQYERHAKFAKSIHIVNLYGGDATSTIFCEILQFAPNTCRDTIRKQEIAGKHLEIDNWFSDAVSAKLAYEDLALAALSGLGHVRIDPNIKGEEFSWHLQKWTKVIEIRMAKMKKNVSDLPMECFNDGEMKVLLDESIKYEKLLLPDFFASSGGEESLRYDFLQRKKTRYCSVDTDLVLNSDQWSALFVPIMSS